MLFSSIPFLYYFLPAVLILYFLVPKSCKNAVLLVSSLVFSAKGGDVAMTMVRGKILYQNGHFPTLDMNAIVSEMMEYAIGKVMEKE